MRKSNQLPFVEYTKTYDASSPVEQGEFPSVRCLIGIFTEFDLAEDAQVGFDLYLADGLTTKRLYSFVSPYIPRNLA